MKKYLLLLTAFASLSAFAQTETMSVKVTNTWNQPKANEPVVVSLAKKKMTVKSARVTLDGKEVPCQLDDMNGDGRFDELIFLTDIEGGAKQTFRVELSATGKPRQYTPRVYAHMGLNDKYGKYPTINGIEAPGNSYIFKDVFPHGAEIESELTAYRIYVDNRQNIDLYGKKKRQLELETTHFYSVQEHLDQGYGNDVLWAGGSMGCGTLREYDPKSGPLLIDDVALRGQRVVSYGPLRTVVEMRDMDWKGHDITTLYILYAGHRELEVQVRSAQPLSDMTLCTGVQRVGGSEVGYTHPDGIAASWGSDYPDYGKKELYKPEAVGLATYVPVPYFAGTATDNLQWMTLLRPDRKNCIRYYVSFCADMEQTDGYHSSEAWFQSLGAWKESLDNPVSVK